MADKIVKKWRDSYGILYIGSIMLIMNLSLKSQETKW